MAENKFMFDGMPVGTFDEPELPRSPGRWRYMPYRGGGHYEMQRQIHAGCSPRCYYDTAGVRVSFSVRACPEYGVLELRDFEITPCNAV